MFDFRTIAIVGGTGSFGHAMAAFLLANTDAVIRIVSRDELKQGQMRAIYGDDRMRYLLGDVRDLPRMQTALHGVDLVFHAAALKHVDKGEYDGNEFVKTNIVGTENVATASRLEGVKKAVFLSTDKSVSPVNTYGATKMVAERLWVRTNAYAPHGTHFTAVRYGNVSGSRGSVIPLWREQIANDLPVTITHLEMSRFWITLEEAVQLAWFAATYGPRGYVMVPRLPAYRIMDLAKALLPQDQVPDVAWRFTGMRPGEKLAEELMTSYELADAITYWRQNVPVYYGVPPLTPSWAMRLHDGWDKEKGHRWAYDYEMPSTYQSGTWPWRLSIDDLRKMLQNLP